MLNPFPDLLYLALLVPFILRIPIGGLFLLEGYRRVFSKREQFRTMFMERWTKHGLSILWVVGIVEIIVGGMFLVGFYTQIAALISIFVVLAAIFVQKFSLLLVGGRMLYIFIFAISLSLLFSGAGPFSFDLPL